MNYSSSQAAKIDAPNMPGMLPSRDSWVYRVKDGFNKTSTSARPRSAQSSLRHGNYTYNSGTLLLNENQSEEQEEPMVIERPKISSDLRKSDSFAHFNSMIGPSQPVITSRPGTAGPLGRSSSSPFLSDSLIATIGLPKKQPPPIPRKQPSVPVFVEHDKAVCRFYGYFIETRVWDYDAPLGVPDIEKDVQRKVVILFYLVDQTVQIIEPKVVNTGFAGGNFYNRSGICKMDGEPLSLTDLTPGNSVVMLGQEFNIYDADQYTRDYFRREMQIVICPPLDHPGDFRQDIGASYSTGMGTTLQSSKKSFATKSTSYLTQREEMDKVYKFLNFEGQVLRFQCVETASLDAETLLLNPESISFPSTSKRFALSYYLADDKVDMRIIKAHAGTLGGLEENMLVLKKSRISKNWRVVRRGGVPDYYSPEDFRCGHVIDVYGRTFLLVSCDNFTKSKYDEIGIEQREVPCDEIFVEEVVHSIPKLGDGFLAIGSNADTLASVYGMPKPGFDLKKMQRNLNRNLRCLARILTDNTIDASRVYMITFYLEDDSLQIYEKSIRNSGINGGVFLKRGLYMNGLPPDESSEPRLFKPTDIFYGNVFSINGNEMQIYEMDNLSLKFCETYPDEFPLFDTIKIVHRLMKKVVAMKMDLDKHFSQFDHSKRGYLGKDQFVSILDSLGVSRELCDQEMLTLLRRFEDQGDKYMYLEMCDLFSHVHFVQKTGTRRPSESQYDDVIASFLRVSRLKSTQWRRTMRKSSHSYKGFITLRALNSIFKRHGFVLNDQTLYALQEIYKIDPKSESPETVKEILKRGGSRESRTGTDDNKTNTMTVTSTSSISKKTSGRIDIRSQARLQATTDVANGLNPIKQRRQVLMTSVLRKNGMSKSMQDDNSRYDETKIIINFTKLCHDIYPCDWV